MFVVNIDKNLVTVSQSEPMTSGSSKVYLCQFYFSDEWAELTRTAVFRAEDKTINILLDEENVCFVPWEVMQIPNVKVQLGVYGTYGEDVVLPTVWSEGFEMLVGVTTGLDGLEPTPDSYQQVLAKLEEIQKQIEELDSLSVFTSFTDQTITSMTDLSELDLLDGEKVAFARNLTLQASNGDAVVFLSDVVTLDYEHIQNRRIAGAYLYAITQTGTTYEIAIDTSTLLEEFLSIRLLSDHYISAEEANTIVTEVMIPLTAAEIDTVLT